MDTGSSRTFAATRVLDTLARKIVDAVPGMLAGLVVLAVFLVLALIARAGLAALFRRVRLDATVALLVSRFVAAIVVAFGVVTALGEMGVDIRALVAGLGLTGFALGFALKDVLGNLVAGVMELVYRPFRIGDTITVAGQCGEVEGIRLRDTLLRHEDGTLVIIPNSKIVTDVVVNRSQATQHDRRARVRATAP